MPPVAVEVEFVKDKLGHQLLLFLRELLDSSDCEFEWFDHGKTSPCRCRPATETVLPLRFYRLPIERPTTPQYPVHLKGGPRTTLRYMRRSADAAYTGGELVSKPLVFSGQKLQPNVDTSAGGVCRVEILDQSSEKIPGFTLDDADEINGNYIRVWASWRGSTDVSALAGKPIKLRFAMRDTKLYSFQFLPNEKE